ncbi:hypothetical protein BKH43_04675 [Helicobacter sp. 13S00401-1]|uniref:CinA family protein n=1 Tax=Helicobacter sp. 13S00401-1 TaxID=1905758 RepID=UPI000BA679E3|nr:CinA family protein [Helicobacter sp. 13S00401-1]PAF50389.1 hypothetical protein BKH43_04675 [Helicobacter sp. 13S00401-1]
MRSFSVLGFEASNIVSLTASLASKYQVSLSAKNEDEIFAKGKDLESFFTELKTLFNQRVIVGNIYKAFLDTLVSKRLTLSMAESCTGGLLASKITAISGASQSFKGSITSYSIESKVNVLKVPKDIIDTFGVYSEECVKHMARCALELFKSDIALATSGICSPIENLPYNLKLGNVFIAIVSKDKLPLVTKESFEGTRIEMQTKACKQAILNALSYLS